jgi:hypothetical protein
MTHYADIQLIESLAQTLVQIFSELCKNAIFFIFTLNDYRLYFGDQLVEIQKEYLVIRMLCDLIQQIGKCIWWTAYLIITNLFCVHVEPVFIKEWVKICYITNETQFVDIHNEFYFDLPFLALPYSHYYNQQTAFMNSYIERYLEDKDEIQRLNLPEYILHVAKENTMMVVRKTRTGQRIVRQFHAEPAAPTNIKDEIMNDVPEKSSVHFLLVYLQFVDLPVKYEINVPIEECYVGNELLSYEYLISYMEHQFIWKTWKIDWNQYYLLKIMDSELNIFEVKRGEYVRLEKDRAVICSIQNVPFEESKDESFEEGTGTWTESSREIRTLSMEEDAEMLMLFSSSQKDHHLDTGSGSDTEDIHKNKKVKYE